MSSVTVNKFKGIQLIIYTHTYMYTYIQYKYESVLS